MNKGYIVLFLLLIIFSFGFGFYMGWTEQKNKLEAEYNIALTNVKTDTITSIDTIYVDRPIPKYVTKLKEVADTIVEYVTDTDTIYVPFNLPIIEKEYENKDYYARIKGVEFGSYPSLESLQIYQTTNTIIEEKTIVKKPKFGWQLTGGLGYGYNPISRKFEPQVGITIGYGINL